MMDRLSLREFLDRERIDPRAYGLDGPAGLPVEDREERYFLEETPAGWSVYYWERGLRSGEHSFASQDEACRHLLDLLLRDSTTRVK
jgi:hypothetical protein